MHRAVWVLLPSLLSSCSADEPASHDEGRARSELVFPAESDLPAFGVLGQPALLPGGRRVEARAGDEPGESDLWLVRANGEAVPLVAAPGPDEQPLALADGRVVFVSGRTTVESLFVVDPKTGALRQLTNRGLVAGKPWKGFVPPPARDARVEGGALRYDDGSGRSWSVDLETGAAESEAAP